MNIARVIPPFGRKKKLSQNVVHLQSTVTLNHCKRRWTTESRPQLRWHFFRLNQPLHIVTVNCFDRMKLNAFREDNHTPCSLSDVCFSGHIDSCKVLYGGCNIQQSSWWFPCIECMSKFTYTTVKFFLLYIYILINFMLSLYHIRVFNHDDTLQKNCRLI